MQLDIHRLNNVEIPAGGYKCISCGHSGATVRMMTGHPTEGMGGSYSMGDDLSVNSMNSAMSLLSDPSTAAVLNRTAGLRPLGGYVEPEDAKAKAKLEKKRAAQAHANRRPTTGTGQEPLYRRARLAAQLREIPKVTQVDLGHVQQYAMDDDINFDDEFSLSSVQSRQSRQPRGQSQQGLQRPEGEMMSRSLPSEPVRLPSVSPAKPNSQVGSIPNSGLSVE